MLKPTKYGRKNEDGANRWKDRLYSQVRRVNIVKMPIPSTTLPSVDPKQSIDPM